jgi:cobalt transporter subunit CbtA
VFTLAPSLGLPPELPGMPAGALAPRQIWWIATALATAAGLAVIVSRRSPWTVALGIALLAAPHLIGAPHAPEEVSEVPVSLWRGFVVAVMLTSLLSWAALGAVTGAFFKRHAV